ncbi:MAG: hypothetical protein ACYTKD_01320 [Planctomycetota bacterium]|jgi:hypothetical protein
MPHFHDILDGFYKGTLEFDCPHMVLRQQCDEDAREYEGPGFVKCDADGSVQFKMYCSVPGRQPPFETTVKTGEIIPEKQLYALRVKDSFGCQWHARHVWPYADEPDDKTKLILRGRIHEMEREEEAPRSVRYLPYLALYTLQPIEFPVNAGTVDTDDPLNKYRDPKYHLRFAKFDACGYSFALRHHADRYVVLHIGSEEHELGSAFRERIAETCQFVFGQPVVWFAAEECSGTTSREVFRFDDGVREEWKHRTPPLANRKYKGAAHVYEIFGRFVKLLLSNPEGVRDRVSELAWDMGVANNASLDARALTAAVSVEAMAGVLAPDCAVAPTEGIDAALDVVRTSSLPQKMISRLVGYVSSMAKPRAVDTLNVLAERGVIPHDYVRTWREVRNPMAHGAQRGWLRDELRWKCGQLTTLFHMLVFHAIGYEGKYTDYSTPGLPERDFPLLKDEDR